MSGNVDGSLSREAEVESCGMGVDGRAEASSHVFGLRILDLVNKSLDTRIALRST